MAETTKFLLSEDAIPTHWVNLLPDLPGEPLFGLECEVSWSARAMTRSPTGAR